MRKQLALPIVLILCLVVGGVIPLDPLIILFDPERALTFEGAMALAERLDELGDQLSELDLPPMPVYSTQLALLELEIVPFFYYDEILEGSPRNVPMFWNINVGERNFHVLGSTRIGDKPLVYLNARFANPYASWYGKQSLFATIIHELAHSQGVYRYSDPLSEPATQLVTVEILAAMSRDGNAWAFPALVREIQGLADDYVFALALKEDRMDEYHAYLERVGDGVWSQAKFERSMDHWANDMATLKSIITRYGVVPYELLIEALNQPDYMTVELLAIPTETHTFAVNDAAWVLQHLAQMAKEYPALLDLWRERHE